MKARLHQVFFNTFSCSFIKDDVIELYFPTSMFTIYLCSVSLLVVVSFTALKYSVLLSIKATRQYT